MSPPKRFRWGRSVPSRREFFFAAGAAIAAEGVRVVDTNGEKVAVSYGGTTLLEYRYSAERPKSYIHPLCLANGQPLTLDGPKDHVHHRGLMVAWSEVNGIDFWGETNPPGTARSATSGLRAFGTSLRRRLSPSATGSRKANCF